MRVLIITGSFPPMRCGVGDYTASLAQALAEYAGCEVAVLTDVEGRSPAKGVSVFPILAGWRFREWRKIRQLIRSWKPDVVHMQFPTQGYSGSRLPWLVPLWLRMSRVKVVQTWHEHFPMGIRVRNGPLAAAAKDIVVVRPNFISAMPAIWQRLLSRKTFWFIANASAIPQVALRDSERTELRKKSIQGKERLIAYFGFVYPHKGTDLLLEILNPKTDHLVLICDLNGSDSYQNEILERIENQGWRDSVTITGFLPPEEVGKMLAVADAVVLPFRSGGGIWNTSLHSAVIQGTFVLTTSTERRGYDSTMNVYYAEPGNVSSMRAALNSYVGTRRADNQYTEWKDIAMAHRRVYDKVLSE